MYMPVFIEAVEWKVTLSPSMKPNTATNFAPAAGLVLKLGLKAIKLFDDVVCKTIELLLASARALALIASALITSSKLVPLILLLHALGLYSTTRLS